MNTLDKKNELVEKLINEDFIIFPCKNKIPSNYDWNKLTKSDSSMITQDDNIGIVCGSKSKILVIDVDFKYIANWNKLLEKNNTEDINTLRVKSANNGKHYYFKIENSETMYKRCIDDDNLRFDIKMNNSYIIAPFSKLINGMVYEFENYDDTKTIREQIQELPIWLYDLIKV